MTEETVPLEDIILDPNNTNIHTEDGHDLLEHSMSSFGFAEAGVLDESNQIIGGEHRTTVARELGMDSARIIDHDPEDGPVYLRLKGYDLDSEDPETRRKSNELSVMLNRAAQRSIRIDPFIFEANAEKFGFETSTYYTDEELTDMKLKWDPSLDDDDSPDFDDYDEPGSSSLIAYRVIVDGLELVVAEDIAGGLTGARVEQYREKITD